MSKLKLSDDLSRQEKSNKNNQKHEVFEDFFENSHVASDIIQ